MTRVAAIAVLALGLTTRGAIAVREDQITPATVVAIERWIAAVRNHAPGRRDPEVDMVSALTFDDRIELNAGMDFFLSFLRGKPVKIKTVAEKALAKVAGETRQIPGADAFLKRAAVLHADAANKRHFERVDLTEPRALPSQGQSEDSPLLSQRSLYLNRDGEVLGHTLADWNWPFARSLLDLLSAPASDDPFVATWYHATAAFMFQRGLYGEAVVHLQRAAAVLPDDPRILFDRASYAEIQGLPSTQVLLSDDDVGARPARGTLGIPDAGDTNHKAERLFRLALRVDPSLVEARVRLGRLLGLRKRHDEAASELATALAANPTGPVLFYAHLFAGRVAQQQGKIADAAEHYKAAHAIFPGAQSAGLARSQAALLESDVATALESIRRIDKSSTARDPWRWYQLAAGRDADARLREMWNEVLKF